MSRTLTAVLVLIPAVLPAQEPLFQARSLTRPGEFTPGIEGPACDRSGNIYAVNFARQGTIGRVTPQGVGEVFVELPEGSIGNGIRFASDGTFFVADYTKHNVLRVNPATKQVTVHAHNAGMNQPNDLTIADDGTLYASDPNWQEGTGQLWRIDTDGTTTRLAAGMGTTNGIEVSPDNSTLYVNESKQRNIWAFTITPDKTLTGKRLLKRFEDHGFDGMRCDIAGNLYVTRYGKGTVVKLSPAGVVLQEIKLPGKRPSNICFGGPDGCTAYVTEVEQTQLVSFRVDQPGLAWERRRRWQASRRVPLIIGHRGASHDAPENTLAAFRLAFKRGADGIEGDFYLTKDGRVVCIHDQDTKRVASETLVVRDATLAELKRLDVGSWKNPAFRDERIPTLREVIGVIPEGKRFVIELKIGPEIVKPLKAVLEQSKFAAEQCLIISFNADVIATARQEMPNIKAHWLAGYKQPEGSDTWTPSAETVVRTLRRTNANGYGSNAKPDVFNDAFLGALRGAGFREFHVWTVNDPDVASYYRDRGAWGITTDRPGFLRKTLRAKN